MHHYKKYLKSIFFHIRTYKSHYLDKIEDEPEDRLKVTKNDKEKAKIAAQNKKIEVGAFQGFIIDDKHARDKKKEERKSKYWKRIVKTDFKPRPSAKKVAELEMIKMKEKKVIKKKFNFVGLDTAAQMVK